MISSMKLRITISIAIGLALVVTAVISTGHITQKAYAAVDSSSSTASGGSLGQSNGLGGASGGGTTVQSGAGGVDRHLFCDTGVEPPICKQ